MAKVLSSISLDAPASPVSASVNDTFAFTGTPSFAGGGGVQRYDFKWEVNDGGGYVTIGASGTGLVTADTNPIVNTNSQAAQSITVDCEQAGSYTIRMAGAPTSGSGSYTVLSSEQTVDVSAAALTGDLAATEPSDVAALAGAVIVAGAMAASDSADVAAATGGILVAGDLAATETPDTLAATGGGAAAGVSGDLSAVEAQDVAAMAGAILVVGGLAAIEAADVAAAAGGVLVFGTIAAAEGADVAALSGAISILGALAATEAADLAAFAAGGVGGGIQYWTGSAWASAPVKVWMGGEWTVKPVKRWTGTEWVAA